MRQKDPNQLWYWILVAICLFAILPVFFLGAIEPFVFGIPLWVAVSLLGTGVLTVVTMIQLSCRWFLAKSDAQHSPDDE